MSFSAYPWQPDQGRDGDIPRRKRVIFNRGSGRDLHSFSVPARPRSQQQTPRAGPASWSPGRAPSRLVPVCSVVAHGPGSDRPAAPSPTAPLLRPSAGGRAPPGPLGSPRAPRVAEGPPRPPPAPQGPARARAHRGRRAKGQRAPRPAAGPVPKPPSGLSARRGRTRGPGGCRSPGSGLPAGAALLREDGRTLCPRRRSPRPPGTAKRTAAPTPTAPAPADPSRHPRGARPGQPRARGAIGAGPAAARAVPEAPAPPPRQRAAPWSSGARRTGVLRPSSAPRAPPPAAAAAPAARSSRVRAPHQPPGPRVADDRRSAPGRVLRGRRSGGRAPGGGGGSGRGRGHPRPRSHPRVRLPAPRETRPQSSRNAGASSPPPRPASEPAELRAARGSARVTRGAALRPGRWPDRAGCGLCAPRGLPGDGPNPRGPEPSLLTGAPGLGAAPARPGRCGVWFKSPRLLALRSGDTQNRVRVRSSERSTSEQTRLLLLRPRMSPATGQGRRCPPALARGRAGSERR